jgi:hypothetical protein
MPETPTEPAPSRPLWRTFLVFLGPLVLTNVCRGFATANNYFYAVWKKSPIVKMV